MAIEDEKYTAVIKAIEDLMGTGRSGFVRNSLIKLAYSILRHYGYEVIDPTADAHLPKI